MAVTTVRVNRTYTDANGRPLARFRPVFTLSWLITDGVTLSDFPAPIQCTTDDSGRLTGPDGQLGVLLACNDSLSPAGSYYTVSGEPFTAATTYQFLRSMAPSVDLATLPPAVVGPPASSYVPADAPMTQLLIVDSNEFHPVIDAAAYAGWSPAIILRAHNGWREDHVYAANRAAIQAQPKIRAVGHYGYVVATLDAQAQGVAFAQTVKAHGGLPAGHFVTPPWAKRSGSSRPASPRPASPGCATARCSTAPSTSSSPSSAPQPGPDVMGLKRRSGG
jgi:hypothetical protein